MITRFLQRAVVSLVFLAGIQNHVHALDSDIRQWSMFLVQGRVSGHVGAYVELQSRLSNDVSRVDQAIVRPALYYSIDPRTSVWAGYMFVPTIEPRFRREHRAWQQLLHVFDAPRAPVVSRSRLEQRLIQDRDVALRFRQLFRTGLPISQDARWQLVLSDEVFVNLNSVSRGPVSGFDQNRFFVGPGRKLTASLWAEVGYMNNYVSVPAPGPDQLNHIASIGIVVSF